MFVAGDIKEISYKHPTLGSGTWFPKSGEDGTVDFGGIESNDDTGMVTSDGQIIDQMNYKRWSFESSVAWDMVATDELAQAKKLAASPVMSDWTFTHISGAIWGAKGKPVGGVQGSTNAGTMKVKLSGGGKLAKI